MFIRNLHTIEKIFEFFLITVLLLACEKDKNAINPKDTDIWQTFNYKNGLTSNKAETILEDSKGNIWVGTTDKGVYRYNGKSWKVFDTSTGLLSNTILSACEDANGKIWFGTSVGINFIRNDTCYYLTNFTHYIQTIAVDKNNGLMVGTFGDGLFVIDKNYNFYPIVFNGQTFSNINTIYESNSHHFWLGTDNGVAEMIPLSTPISYNCNYYKKTNGLVSDSVYSVAQDDWGNYWFGHLHSRSLTKYNGTSFSKVLMPIPWPLTVYSMFNVNHNLWVGTFGMGILKYDGAFFYPINKVNGLAGSFICNITIDKAGNIWIGTYDNGVSKYIP